MNCKKVRRWLPLMAGSDLSASKAEAAQAHLAECPECQREYDAFILSIEKMKEWLKTDRNEWDETEWKQAVRKADVSYRYAER